MTTCRSTELSAYRGDDISLNIVVKRNGTEVVDITGTKVMFTIKENPDDADSAALVSVTVSTHTAPTLGQTNISVAHSLTDALAGQYYYDFQYVDATGFVQTPSNGIFIFYKDITRRTT